MASHGKNWRVILTLVLSALGILYFMVSALSLGVLWLVSILDSTSGVQQSLAIGLLLWSSVLGGVLLAPVLLLSIYHVRGKPKPGWLDTSQPVFGKLAYLLILAWPAVVLLGWLVAGRPNVAAFILGPINLLVAGLPVLWIYHTAQRGLPGGSQIRRWKIFGLSIAVLPVIVTFVELIAILVLGGMGGIWLGFRISTNPQLETEIMNLVNQVLLLGDDLEVVLQFLEPYILQPSVIFWAIAIFGGIIPIIEEVLKPLVLWALAGRKISPQDGFIGGLLCGAGFALMENVLFFTNVLLAEDWLSMAIGRAGTGLLHMLASGLVGWGLAKAWRDGNWVFQALTTLGAFILHALWNVLALFSGVAPLMILDADPTLLQAVLFNVPTILLLVISILCLFLINRHLRRQSDMTWPLPAESAGDRGN